ncbi:hypothetical protein PLEOSDRAFT_162916 [Pleurotus ostreatus PC15]|uniref:Uncharacterized protein n=1 Tax=Pleurotus ostreatus (strain PC15) TaxID=1137138 RepID=A0A067N5D5_PLEO1|nr:hypothetical protein PLEOSDRAFT_162916 [Pleurotus ostreatus PC15]
MVSSPSPAMQVIEAEKKRKFTLERAKANHLSRQLQLRLQYAKLKVDHGWQKQSLNEVENLYFRHSHLHGHKSQASAAPLVATTTSQNTSAVGGTTQSSLSFKLGSSFSMNSLREDDTPILERSITHLNESAGDIYVEQSTTRVDSTPFAGRSSQPSTSKTSQSLKSQPTELISSQAPSNPHSSAPWPSPPLASSAPLPSSSSSSTASSSLYYRSSASTISSTQSNPAENRRFSNTSLTYDSFWSSLGSTSSAEAGASTSMSRTSASRDVNGKPGPAAGTTNIQGGYRPSKGSRHPQDKES